MSGQFLQLAIAYAITAVAMLVGLLAMRAVDNSKTQMSQTCRSVHAVAVAVRTTMSLGRVHGL